MGECISPLSRLPSYIRTVEVPGLRPEDFKCAIHRHFVETLHEKSDMRICLVDAVPLHINTKPSLLPATRKKLENRWIHRLEAELNVKRFQHGSFSGDFAARAADQEEDLVYA